MGAQLRSHTPRTNGTRLKCSPPKRANTGHRLNLSGKFARSLKLACLGATFLPNFEPAQRALSAGSSFNTFSADERHLVHPGEASERLNATRSTQYDRDFGAVRKEHTG